MAVNLKYLTMKFLDYGIFEQENTVYFEKKWGWDDEKYLDSVMAKDKKQVMFFIFSDRI